MFTGRARGGSLGDYAGEQSDERLQGTGCQTRRAGERGFAEICWVDQRQGVR